MIVDLFILPLGLKRLEVLCLVYHTELGLDELSTDRRAVLLVFSAMALSALADAYTYCPRGYLSLLLFSVCTLKT